MSSHEIWQEMRCAISALHKTNWLTFFNLYVLVTNLPHIGKLGSVSGVSTCSISFGVSTHSASLCGVDGISTGNSSCYS